MANLEALKAELGAGHPVTGPYSTDNHLAAAEVNAKNRSVDRSLVPGWEVFVAIAPADFLTVYTTGPEAHRSYLNVLFVLDSVPIEDAGVRAALKNIFAGMGGTLAALKALEGQLISRAQELDIGNVGAGTIGAARTL